MSLQHINKLISIFDKSWFTYTPDIVNIANLYQMITEVNVSDLSCIQFNPSHFVEPSQINFGHREDCDLSTCHSLQFLCNVFSEKTSYNLSIDHQIAMLNAFHHLSCNHSHEFQNIYYRILKLCNNNKSCDLKTCEAMSRNHRNRASITEDESQLNRLYADMDMVSQQIYDIIHCYYFHSFDTGYKLTVQEKENIVRCDAKTNDYKDKHILEINAILSNKRASYKNIKGLARLNNPRNKFMSQQNENQFQLDTFSYGYRYFYWKHYKNNSNIHDDSHINACKSSKWTYDPPIANAGTTLGDWYIEKKYDNFKEELLKNAIFRIGIQQWRNLCKKEFVHMQTDKVKKMKCSRTISASYYDMNCGQKMSDDHIISLMAYCNYDLLQRKFTETYRKNKGETDEELKQRHRNYYFLGKLLRECVECFGTMRQRRKKKNHEPLCDTMVIFQGINQEFIFPSLTAYIKGPMSTTTDFAVAIHFCANMGMIIETYITLNNRWKLEKPDEIEMKMEIHVDYFNFMDMSWISDFSNEQEIFFIGGLAHMSFTSILRVQTGDNYSAFIDGMHRMTSCMKISESSLQMDRPSTPLQKQIAFRLLSHELYVQEPHHKQAIQFHGIPKYIEYLLHSHCKSIKMVHFSYQKRDLSPFHFNFFHYDNGWMKLNLIMTLFPNVTQISCGEWNSNEVMQAFFYENCLRYLQENFLTTALRQIMLCLGNISKENDAILDNFINKYTNMFYQYGWNVDLEVDDDFYNMGLECGIPPIRSVMVVLKSVS